MGVSGVGGVGGAASYLPSQDSKQQLANDLNAYESDPTLANYQKVVQDIENLQHSGAITSNTAHELLSSLSHT